MAASVATPSIPILLTAQGVGKNSMRVTSARPFTLHIGKESLTLYSYSRLISATSDTMKTLLSFGFLAGLVLLMGEFDALTTSVILAKVIAVATMVICGALLPHYVTEEELND
jgi:hypothetical protein